MEEVRRNRCSFDPEEHTSLKPARVPVSFTMRSCVRRESEMAEGNGVGGPTPAATPCGSRSGTEISAGSPRPSRSTTPHQPEGAGFLPLPRYAQVDRNDRNRRDSVPMAVEDYVPYEPPAHTPAPAPAHTPTEVLEVKHGALVDPRPMQKPSYTTVIPKPRSACSFASTPTTYYAEELMSPHPSRKYSIEREDTADCTSELPPPTSQTSKSFSQRLSEHLHGDEAFQQRLPEPSPTYLHVLAKPEEQNYTETVGRSESKSSSSSYESKPLLSQSERNLPVTPRTEAAPSQTRTTGGSSSCPPEESQQGGSDITQHKYLHHLGNGQHVQDSPRSQHQSQSQSQSQLQHQPQRPEYRQALPQQDPCCSVGWKPASQQPVSVVQVQQELHPAPQHPVQQTQQDQQTMGFGIGQVHFPGQQSEAQLIQQGHMGGDGLQRQQPILRQQQHPQLVRQEPTPTVIRGHLGQQQPWHSEQQLAQHTKPQGMQLNHPRQELPPPVHIPIAIPLRDISDIATLHPYATPPYGHCSPSQTVNPQHAVACVAASPAPARRHWSVPQLQSRPGEDPPAPIDKPLPAQLMPQDSKETCNEDVKKVVNSGRSTQTPTVVKVVPEGSQTEVSFTQDSEPMQLFAEPETPTRVGSTTATPAPQLSTPAGLAETPVVPSENRKSVGAGPPGGPGMGVTYKEGAPCSTHRVSPQESIEVVEKMESEAKLLVNYGDQHVDDGEMEQAKCAYEHALRILVEMLEKCASLWRVLDNSQACLPYVRRCVCMCDAVQSRIGEIPARTQTYPCDRSPKPCIRTPFRCTQCGTPSAKAANFCPSCGSSLHEVHCP
eukprot:TRINITY_DN11323_c0_g1_i1.p1 TRINITY_DN11323_c0_g1~~TRINITY_DN11323_c0_g1_i1.p1  ORF type:complete len:829 (+),score=75.40 TRINITY_DN11323_c0_g1_i1:383-2869(+)